MTKRAKRQSKPNSKSFKDTKSTIPKFNKVPMNDSGEIKERPKKSFNVSSKYVLRDFRF